MKAGRPLSSDGLSASQKYNQHRQPPPSTQIIHPMSRIPLLTHLVLSPCFSIIENFSYFPHPPPSLRLVRRSHVGRSDEKVSSCCRLAICSLFTQTTSNVCSVQNGRDTSPHCSTEDNFQSLQSLVLKLRWLSHLLNTTKISFLFSDWDLKRTVWLQPRFFSLPKIKTNMTIQSLELAFGAEFALKLFGVGERGGGGHAIYSSQKHDLLKGEFTQK